MTRIQTTLSVLAAALVLTCAACPIRASESNPRVDTSGVNVLPPYPASAIPDRESGAAVLAVGVNANGAVEKVSPVKTSGFDDLDAAAIAGVMNWKFIPATKDGRAVAGAALVQIAFQPPPDKSGKPAKAGVQADYLPADFTVDAALKEASYKDKAVPCSKGSLSVAMQFMSAKTPPNSVDGDATLWIALGNGQKIALIGTSPAYYPPEYQFVSFALTDAKGNKIWSDRYQFAPQFRHPAVLTFSWTRSGQITASVGGQDLQAELPGAPTSFSFAAESALGRFTNARLICVPEQNRK